MSEIDFYKKQEVYEKAILGMNKYLAGMDGKHGSGDKKGIKLESEFYTKEEEVLLVTRVFYRGGPSGRGGRRGGHGGSSGCGGWGGGAGNAIYGGKDNVKEKDETITQSNRSEWRATPVPGM